MRSDTQNRLPQLQQLEVSEYLSAFKVSSDRARYVIYINTVVSVLILICSWNMAPWSWSRRRIDLVEEKLKQQYAKEFAVAQHQPPPPQKKPASVKEYVEERLRDDRWTAYRNATLPEVLFVPVPGIGAHIDVNDLGFVGGASLLVLAALLCFSMVRQHENLYLTLFKVRRFCQSEPRAHHDGESMANFLYHAMAMGQVLNYPPTLARWGYGWRNMMAGNVRWTILLLPALVQGFVVVTNIYTIHLAKIAWGTDVTTRIAIQSILCLGILAFCVLAGLYSRACNLRWRDAFDLINPGLRRIEQRKWSEWLRLRWSWRRGDPDPLAPVLREITYSLRPDLRSGGTIAEGTATATMPLPAGEHFSKEELQQMAEKIHANARQQAGEGEIVSYEAEKNTFANGLWTVEMKFKYRKR